MDTTDTPIDKPTPDSEAGDVIDLSRAWQGAESSGPMAQVEAYWHAIRGERLVPDRSDVDPRGIEGALSNAFVAERIAAGHARIRIAGTHLGDLMGMEVRGMPLSAMFEPASRDRLQSALRSVFDDPAVYKFELIATSRIGKPELRAKLCILPLRNDLGDVSRALGCLVTDGTIGRAPRRFAIQRSQREELVRSVFGSKRDAIDPGETAAIHGFAESQGSFQNTSVPYLRVVSDNT